MALIQVNFISKSLMRTVTVNAIVPFDKIFGGTSADSQKPFKTLYLLHGIFGNYTDWVSGTRIQRWAEEKNLAVIMPSGENHFYLDSEATGERYSEFIGKELPAAMEKLFHLSSKREDRFIAGLSMGGYGAIVNGLRFADNFSCIAGLSAALLDINTLGEGERDLAKTFFGNHYYDTFFGTKEKRTGSNCDIYALADKVSKAEDKPKIFLCCGTSDGLIAADKAFYEKCKALGYDVTWYEEAGAHEWDFWDRNIKRVIDWLPLDDAKAGINSGNVQ